MAKLTTKARNALPTKDFAGPRRSYPIQDASHARNALARASQNASPAEQASIRRKVEAKFPSIDAGKKRNDAAAKKLTARLDRRGR